MRPCKGAVASLRPRVPESLWVTALTALDFSLDGFDGPDLLSTGLLLCCQRGEYLQRKKQLDIFICSRKSHLLLPLLLPRYLVPLHCLNLLILDILIILVFRVCQDFFEDLRPNDMEPLGILQGEARFDFDEDISGQSTFSFVHSRSCQGAAAKLKRLGIITHD